MKLHRYVDHQRLHIVTKDVISLSISVLLLFRHYISHKITFGAPSSGGVLCSACGAFIVSVSSLVTMAWCRCPCNNNKRLDTSSHRSNKGTRCLYAGKYIIERRMKQ